MRKNLRLSEGALNEVAAASESARIVELYESAKECYVSVAQRELDESAKRVGEMQMEFGTWVYYRNAILATPDGLSEEASTMRLDREIDGWENWLTKAIDYHKKIVEAVAPDATKYGTKIPEAPSSRLPT